MTILSLKRAVEFSVLCKSSVVRSLLCLESKVGQSPASRAVVSVQCAVGRAWVAQVARACMIGACVMVACSACWSDRSDRVEPNPNPESRIKWSRDLTASNIALYRQTQRQSQFGQQGQ
jgi:hypothetical protein